MQPDDPQPPAKPEDTLPSGGVPLDTGGTAAMPSGGGRGDASENLPAGADATGQPTLLQGLEGPVNAPLFDSRYRVLRELGKGGFGRVLLVEDTLHSGQPRALKTILPQRQAQDQFERRFRNEIHVMRSLQHPGIPQIFNDGRTAEGEFYFTMAHVNGRPFSSVMKEEGALAPERVAKVLRDVVEVLCYAHERGVVHRDLKPDNILLQDEGTPDESVRVLDFGIAKILEKEGELEHAQSMQTQSPIGTPHYMSPEQVSGRSVSGSTDMYALGILIYQLLSGRYPFKGTTFMELMAARLHQEPEPLSPKLEPAWARSLVPRLLARDPERRPTAPQVLLELDEILAGRAPGPATPSAKGRAMAITGLAAVGAAALAFTLLRGEADADPAEASPGSPSTLAALQGDAEVGGPALAPSEADDAPAAGPEAIAESGGDLEVIASDAVEPDAVTSDGAPTSEQQSGDAAPPATASVADGQPSEGPADESPPGGGGREGGSTGRFIDDSSHVEAVKSAPVAPAEPLTIELAGGGLVVPFTTDVLTLEGCSNRPLARLTVNGAAARIDGDRFEAEVSLEPGSNAVVLVFEDGDGQEGERSITVQRATARPAPAGTTDLGAGVSPDGWPLRLRHDASELEFVFVAAGSSDATGGFVEARRPYYLGATEVDRAAYRRYSDDRRLEMPDPPRGTADDPQLPIVQITRDDAAHFAGWAGARLPSADELRWAAVGPQGLKFPWGSSWDPTRCNASGDADGYTALAPVRALAAGASWCGAQHLCGNVSEWTSKPGESFGGSYSSRQPGPDATSGNVADMRKTIGFRVALDLE